MAGSLTVNPDARYAFNPLADAGATYDFKTNSNVVDLGAGDWKIQGTTVDSTAAEINRVTDVSNSLVDTASTLAVTEALHAGKTVKMATLAGSVYTLPLALGTGGRYRFVVTVKPTSNSHIIKVGNASDFMSGIIYMLDGDANAITGYVGDGTADDTVTMNATTTGGNIGDWIECEDVLLNVWNVRGSISVTIGQNVADPFSATV